MDDTGVIDPEEIENSRKTMSSEEFMQELFCSFNSSAKGAVYALELTRARNENRISAVPWQRDHKVHTVWDIGVGPAMAIGFYQRVDVGMYMIDFWQGTENDGIEQAVLAVKNKGYVYGTHFAPHDISTRETSTGKARIDFARDLGLSFSVIDSKTNIDDGIQIAKFMFDRLKVDKDKCAMWIDAISEYRREWDDKRNMFKEIPYHNWTSHAADVHRYAALIENKMIDDYEDYPDIPFNTPNYDPYW